MTSSIKPYSLTKLPEYVTLEISSNLDYIDLTHFFETCKGFYAFREEKNERLERGVFSHIKIFGRKEWKEYWNGDITDAYDPDKIDRVVLLEFLKCYYGRHPLKPGRVKDHCLIPTVVPKIVTSEGKEKNHGHQLLSEIVKHPSKGHSASYEFFDLPEPRWTPQNLDAANRAQDASLAIVLNESVAVSRYWSRKIEDPDPLLDRWRGQVQYLENLNDRTRFGCEIEPGALQQNTVLFAHRAVTGEIHLTNQENQFMDLRTKDVIQLEGPNRETLRCRGNFLVEHPVSREDGIFSVEYEPASCNLIVNVISDAAVAVIRKFGKDVSPPTPTPPPPSRWISISFVQRQYMIAAAEFIPVIGPVIGVLNLEFDKTMGPIWAARHLRCNLIGVVSSFAIACCLALLISIPVMMPLLLVTYGCMCLSIIYTAWKFGMISRLYPTWARRS
jgi:hypothetical protein